MAKGRRSRARLAAFLGELVRTRRAGAPRPDLLSQLAHARGPEGELLTVDDVVAHMAFLLLAAHDTTTATSTVMLWHLAAEPEWQERVAAELAGLDGQDVTLGNYGSLKQTEWVMKEALRLHPPVPWTVREAVCETEVAGVRLAAGGVVSLPILGLHRHPDWWREPDRFDPMRFSPERAEDKAHSHLFVPFGGGAHLCLGVHLAELIVKAVLAAVLTEHRLTVPRGDRLDMMAIPIPKPRRPATIRLTAASTETIPPTID